MLFVTHLFLFSLITDFLNLIKETVIGQCHIKPTNYGFSDNIQCKKRNKLINIKKHKLTFIP